MKLPQLLMKTEASLQKICLPELKIVDEISGIEYIVAGDSNEGTETLES